MLSNHILKILVKITKRREAKRREAKRGEEKRREEREEKRIKEKKEKREKKRKEGKEGKGNKLWKTKRNEKEGNLFFFNLSVKTRFEK